MRTGLHTTLAGVFMLMAFTGCIQPKPMAEQPAASPWSLTARYDTGSLLSPPRVESQSIGEPSPQDMVVVELGLLALTDAQVGQLPGASIASQATLITSSGGSQAVLASTSLTNNLRWLTGDQARSFWEHAGQALSQPTASPQPASPIHALLGPGATLRLDVRHDKTVSTPQNGSSPDLATADANSKLMLSLALGAASAAAATQPAVTTQPATTSPAAQTPPVRLALTITGQVARFRRPADQTPPSTRPADAGSQTRREGMNRVSTQSETAVIDLPDFITGPLPVVVLMPVTLAVDQPGWLAIRLQATDQTPTEEDLSARRDSLTQSREVAASQPASLPGRFASPRADVATALSLLADPATRRSAMLSLAGSLGATFTADVALVADEMLLEALSVAITQQASQLDASQADTLGWVMDRTTFDIVSQQTATPTLNRLAGVLATHLGEPARRPAMLRDLMESTQTRRAFETRLQAENLIALEDDYPAARVRAYDWLKLKNLAPKDYDPLGSPQSRRQALEQSTTAAPTGATP